MTQNLPPRTNEENILQIAQKLEQINFFFALSGKMEDLYSYIESKMNLYLPKINSKCMTEKYLESTLKKHVITIENKYKKSIIYCSVATKQEIIREIEKILFNIMDERFQKKPLGFDETNPPDKLWLKNLLFLLNDKHPLLIPPKNYINEEILLKLEPRYI